MKHRRGLTLLEVVLALGLLAVVGSLLSAFVFDLDRNGTVLGAQARRVADCSVLFDRLELAVQTAVVQTPGGEAGVTIEDGSLAIVSTRDRSAPATTPGGDAFVTLRCRDTSEGIRLTEQAGGSEPVEGLVLPGSKVAFRAHDGEVWRDAYDSAGAGSMPSMIEVSVWYTRSESDAVAGDEEDDFGIGLDVESGTPIETERARGPDRRRLIALPDPVTARSGGAS